MEELRSALAEVNLSRKAHLAACRAAWEALRKASPQLATDISAMWPNDDVAAEWVCSPLSRDLSPIDMVLAGRTDLVHSILRGAEHGFCA